MPLEVGAEAPDATLFVEPREPVSLKQLQGGDPLVLLFFPLAFSSVCTEEMCAVADDYDAYRDLGAKLAAISVDSPYTNVKFAEACSVPFPILSDFNKEAIRAYGVMRENLGGLKGVSERAVFVIDGDGRIAYAWQGEHPGVMPPFDAVK
ncbi:MAG: redoxin domain-containing protein, partial [Longimicrobiales bacterium]